MEYSKKIRLDLSQIREFVNAATRCDFDIDIASDQQGRYIVDAKSILGVMGLNLNGVLVVSYNGYDEAFENYLSSLSLAA